MTVRQKQILWIDKMKKDHPSVTKMMKTLASNEGRASYAYKLQQIMAFAAEKKYVKNNEDFESLLTYEPEQLTDILEDFVNYLENRGLVSSSVAVTLTAVELFFEMNRRIWHKKLVKRSIQKENRISGGGEPATTEDLNLMLKYCERSVRKRSIILFLGSTGIRPGGLIDPVLRMKHLVWMPDPANPTRNPEYCYAVKIYDLSKEGYWAFLTPEASKTLQRYFDSRKRIGEEITSESPIFVNIETRWKSKYEYLSDSNLQAILSKIINGSGVTRKKVGNTYDKSVVYMFRKRFNTILKINNSVNSNIAEKLMAHKRGLDGTYLQPTREECFAEFVKAIPDLTIDQAERQKAIIKIKNKKIDELESTKEENILQQDAIKRLEKAVDLLLKREQLEPIEN